MVKLIIFDLDGVLVSTKMLHFNSLNSALAEVNENLKISYEDHIKNYDGLPTIKKLSLLTKYKGLDESLYDKINKRKQEFTFSLIKETIKYDERLVSEIKRLKDDGYKIYVASNSIRETTKLLLYKTGIIEYVDVFLSNEDVNCSKPNPEIYLSAMITAGVSPKETCIIEDSPIGIEGATNSCGNLLIVKTPEEVTYDKIKNKIMSIENKSSKITLDNLNILIPMEGEGSRFKSAGYTFPKPLIEINGKPMIQVVIESLGIKANYIYVVKKEHYDKYNLQYMLNLITPGCKIITSENKTIPGAIGACLCAKELYDNDAPLLICNSDQWIDWNPIEFYYKMVENKCDGGILTFNATHPKWSYVKVDNEENVIELAEKKVISNIATVGIYYYASGKNFVKYANDMIGANDMLNGEYYVAPIYNYYIKDNKKIKIYNVKEMCGLGTPEDLNQFLRKHENV